jgi:methylglyoxal/glyoxal reductase
MTGPQPPRERELHGGAIMPPLGLGSYRSGPGREAQEAFACALRLGYRLIDTSLAYGNERDLGAALRATAVPRSDVFITSKLENDDQGYDSALRAFEQTLANLGTDYLDLYLLHWPVPGRRDDSWRALQRLREEGSCRAIGVSNYTVRHLEELLAWADVVPAVDQVECHPFLQQRELLEYCEGRGIVLEAYSPLAKAERFDEPVLVEVARRRGASPAQVMLAWALLRGTAPIPKSVRVEHLRENLDAVGLELDGEEIGRIEGLDRDLHLDWDPTDEP